MRKKDGKYVCMVKGGHCIDITYYDPGENITKFYEEDQSYCHKRSCAKKTFRLDFYSANTNRPCYHQIFSTSWGVSSLIQAIFEIYQSMKGCVASDDFILEVWKRKFESKNPNITITEGKSVR